MWKAFDQFQTYQAEISDLLVFNEALVVSDGMNAKVKEDRAAYGKEVVAGSKKAGVFWHTQGSGKSISMCCYAGKLLQQPEMNNPTLVV